MLFCALASVKAAPRGAAERLAESAGLLRRRDAQNARQPRTRFETRIIKGRIQNLFETQTWNQAWFY